MIMVTELPKRFKGELGPVGDSLGRKSDVVSIALQRLAFRVCA